MRSEGQGYLCLFDVLNVLVSLTICTHIFYWRLHIMLIQFAGSCLQSFSPESLSITSLVFSFVCSALCFNQECVYFCFVLYCFSAPSFILRVYFCFVLYYFSAPLFYFLSLGKKSLASLVLNLQYANSNPLSGTQNRLTGKEQVAF
jgi:hypothetical protein